MARDAKRRGRSQFAIVFSSEVGTQFIAVVSVCVVDQLVWTTRARHGVASAAPNEIAQSLHLWTARFPLVSSEIVAPLWLSGLSAFPQALIAVAQANALVDRSCIGSVLKGFSVVVFGVHDQWTIALPVHERPPFTRAKALLSSDQTTVNSTCRRIALF